MTYKIGLTLGDLKWETLPEHIRNEQEMVRMMATIVCEMTARVFDLHIGCVQAKVVDSYNCPMFDDLFDRLCKVDDKCRDLLEKLGESDLLKGAEE